MILVRTEFQCKWGRVREVVDGFKAQVEGAGDQDVIKRTRILTDLSGRFDRVVIESEIESIDAYLDFMQAMFASPEFQEMQADLETGPYQSGSRDFYTIEATYEA